MIAPIVRNTEVSGLELSCVTKGVKGTIRTFRLVPRVVPLMWRRTFTLPADPARAGFTMRNYPVFTLRVNGHVVGEGDANYGNELRKYDLTNNLTAGLNEVTIDAESAGGYVPSVSFYGELFTVADDGMTTRFDSDDKWEYSFDGETWLKPEVRGRIGISRNEGGDYAQSSLSLHTGALDVKPDDPNGYPVFDSDRPIRWTVRYPRGGEDAVVTAVARQMVDKQGRLVEGNKAKAFEGEMTSCCECGRARTPSAPQSLDNAGSLGNDCGARGAHVLPTGRHNKEGHNASIDGGYMYAGWFPTRSGESTEPEAEFDFRYPMFKMYRNNGIHTFAGYEYLRSPVLGRKGLLDTSDREVQAGTSRTVYEAKVRTQAGFPVGLYGEGSGSEIGLIPSGAFGREVYLEDYGSLFNPGSATIRWKNDACFYACGSLNEHWVNDRGAKKWWWRNNGVDVYDVKQIGENAFFDLVETMVAYTPKLMFHTWLDVNVTSAQAEECRRFVAGFYATPLDRHPQDVPSVTGVLAKRYGDAVQLVNATPWGARGKVRSAECGVQSATAWETLEIPPYGIVVREVGKGTLEGAFEMVPGCPHEDFAAAREAMDYETMRTAHSRTLFAKGRPNRERFLAALAKDGVVRVDAGSWRRRMTWRRAASWRCR